MNRDRAALLALIEASRAQSEANYRELSRLVNDLCDRQEAEKADQVSKPRPAYRPRSILYLLAWNSMQAFLSEKGRLPTALELLDEMDLYDFDHHPLKPKLDTERKVIRWTDPDDGKKETPLQVFQNALTPMRNALA